ncbi:MAG: YdcF family protein [Pseudomonadota bacterium]|nr:YdcF family protein [Pseudomonadota bacterium]
MAWVGGFTWFVLTTVRPASPPPHADGIVALTGGADRVRFALRLLSEGHGGRLLVTGIGGGAGFKTLAEQAGTNPGPLAGQVTLGRGATSTRGNAEETAAWVRANGVRSLIVVTSSYHMPRALTEMARAMPGLKLYPAPVAPASMQTAAGLASVAAVELLAAEYTKFLGAELGVTTLARSDGPELSAARHESRRE